MRSILKSRKGISPILATLLLIVIGVAAIVVTYAWIMTFMGAQTGSGGTLLTWENVYWNSTDSTTTIWVKNIGTSNAKIVRLYAGPDSNTFEVTAYTNIGTGILLPIKETVTIVLNWPNILGDSWIPGKTYTFKVSPEVGTQLVFPDTTPPL